MFLIREKSVKVVMLTAFRATRKGGEERERERERNQLKGNGQGQRNMPQELFLSFFGSMYFHPSHCMNLTILFKLRI